MTAEERAVLNQFTHGHGCGCSYCVHTREVITAAYGAGEEAGRSAGLEEAANLMRLEASTNAQGRHFAAAIRALKNKALEPLKPGE